MFEHHRAAIETLTARLAASDEPLALLVGGSIAHGFATPASDVDVLIVVSPEAYRERVAREDVLYFETESTPYEGGYVDGKYISLDFMRSVAERGSEPSRYAFKDAIVAFSRLPELEALLATVTAYPVAGKGDRLRSFYGQLQAWHWYVGEATRHGNDYLLTQAVANLVLFAGRLVLTDNELLYPYHKWFLRVLEGAERKPGAMMRLIDDAVARRDVESTEALYQAVECFKPWTDEPSERWGTRFMIDTEQAWLAGRAPIGEI